jgi:hypothetical protein
VRACPPGQMFDRQHDTCVARCYWNERMNQCRPVQSCPAGQLFDREQDACVRP